MSSNNSHHPRKRFGQNFLTDMAVVSQIVSAINPSRQDHIVEIGPGMGVLTQSLLPLVQYLDAVELDRDLVKKLKATTLPIGNFSIHSADALEFDFCSLQKGDLKMKVIGNLPYNISTPLLFRLFEQMKCIKDMHFMLQKEVVDRLVALPGNRTYGKLSVMVQYLCQVDRVFDVSPHAFSPQPKVESSVVRLVPHINPPVQLNNYANFKKIVNASFAQRRKTLHNNLKALLSDEQLLSVNVEPSRRGETLSLAEFADLSNLLVD
jgi:16S rRNA (adenine1518-N6/adenine1519-N6)-dimethyltransferase